MSAPEKIVLPRSGLALSKGYAGALVAPGSDVRLALDTRPGGGCPIAWVRNDAGHVFETNEAAIGWLDARVLSLRSALLPPGGFVVVDDEAARAKVAQAINETCGMIYTIQGPAETESQHRRRQARAVISALCGEEGK